jgi:hypothetical protein
MGASATAPGFTGLPIQFQCAFGVFRNDLSASIDVSKITAAMRRACITSSFVQFKRPLLVLLHAVASRVKFP